MVVIATGYEMDGPGSNPFAGEIFCTMPDRLCCPYSLLYNAYRLSFPGVKRPERGVNHPHHLGPRLKKKYRYTCTPPTGLSGRSRMNFTFTIFPAITRALISDIESYCSLINASPNSFKKIQESQGESLQMSWSNKL